MAVTRVERIIDAPAADVFRAVADVETLARALPHVVAVEVLSDRRRGVGTRFRETRDLGGRLASMVLEVVEYVEAERVRLRADSGGTIWESVFAVEAVGDQTRLVAELEPQAYRLLPKVVNPWLRRGLTRGVAADLDAVKEWCELRTTTP